MLARGGGNLFAAEHTRQFFNARFGIQYFDFADGLFAIAVFGHLPVVFAARGHLRQMGNRQHLVFPPQKLQRLAHRFGNAAADACVHFVENQRGHLGVLAGNDLNRQANPRQFAARCHFVQRLEAAAFVGGYLVLDVFQAVLGRLRRQQFDMEFRAFHGQLLHMRRSLFRQGAGCFCARRR